MTISGEGLWARLAKALPEEPVVGHLYARSVANADFGSVSMVRFAHPSSVLTVSDSEMLFPTAEGSLLT
jgi:hypothetical protein